MINARLFSALSLGLCLIGWALVAAAADLPLVPDVTGYNLRLGSQVFGSRYHFTTNALVLEGAEQLVKLGSDIVKFNLSAKTRRKGTGTPPSLTGYVQANPIYMRLFDMPFHHYFAWTSVASHESQSYWREGPNPIEDRREYAEIKEFTRYLLTRYNGTGKKFYLGHWEGDWLLLGQDRHGDNNPTPAAVLGMRSWLNARQQAVDDAKRVTPHTNVDVFVYTEVNRVRDAMENKSETNIRLVNAVLPYVTNLDYVSYSSYDAQNLAEPELDRTLDYIVARTSTNKAAVIPGRRVFVGEYGFGGGQRPPEQQVEPTRAYLTRLLRWGVPFALFWQVYNNERDNFFCLIDAQGKPTPCYDLHRQFLTTARLRVAEFKQAHERLPTDTEFVALALSLLESSASPHAK